MRGCRSARSSGINIAAAIRVAKRLGPGPHGGDDPVRRRLALSVEAVQPGVPALEGPAGAGVDGMTRRIAIGGFLHESHSFAPRPTRYVDFVHPAGFPPLTEGAAVLEAVRGTSVPAAGALAIAEADGATHRSARLGVRQSCRPGTGRGVRAHCGADLCRTVAGVGRGAARWGLPGPAWGCRGGEFPRRRRRTAAPRPRHRRRHPADHQPRSARQPDAPDGHAGRCPGAVPHLPACRHEGRRRAGDAPAAAAHRARQALGARLSPVRILAAPRQPVHADAADDRDHGGACVIGGAHGRRRTGVRVRLSLRGFRRLRAGDRRLRRHAGAGRCGGGCVRRPRRRARGVVRAGHVIRGGLRWRRRSNCRRAPRSRS